MNSKTILTLAATVALFIGAGCGKVAEKATEKAAEAAIEHAIKQDGGDASVKMDMKDGKMAMTVSGKDADGKPINIQMQGGDDGFNMNMTAPGGNGNVTQVTSQDGNVKVVTKDAEGKETETVAQGNEQGMVYSDGSGVVMTTGDKAKVPDDFPKDVPIFAGAKVSLASSDPASKSYTLQLTTSAKPADVTAFYDKDLSGKGWTKEMDMAQDAMHMLAMRKDNRSVTVTCTVDGGGATIFLAVTEG